MESFARKLRVKKIDGERWCWLGEGQCTAANPLFLIIFSWLWRQGRAGATYGQTLLMYMLPLEEKRERPCCCTEK